MRRVAGALLLTVAVACGGSSSSLSSDTPAAQGGTSTTTPAEITYVPIDGTGGKTFLPVGRVPAEIYTVQASPRLAALGAKLQSNPDALLEQVAKAEPGEPLPYDPSLGLTRVEYEELLGLMENLEPTKAADSSFTVTREGSTFRFDGGRRLSDLDGVTVDLGSDSVTTPFGVADVRSVSPGDVDSAQATWPWTGVTWELEEGFEGIEEDFDVSDLAGAAGRVVHFSIGRRLSDGAGLLYFKVRVAEDGAITESIDTILTFPLPV